MYGAAYAMEMAARNHEIIAENLAHSTTPGYRRQALIFEASATSTMPPAADASLPAPSPATLAQSYLRLEPGPFQMTTNPLDLAISGDAFFVVEGPNGPLYTRNGSFELSPGGELRTRGGGYRVSGQGGAITVPVDAGPVTVGADGTVTAGNTTVGRLQLASFERPELLRRAGPTLFESDAPQTPPPGSVRVDQGFRETSNVQPVQEMISMMLGMRLYEAAGKSLQALSDAVALNTRPQQA
jgi:flagellar basal body rod protein FlgG